jgi:[FeFe] hydrogenase H-cluster maturation GTPase HydF
MTKTPNSNRVHIGIFGKTNSGKSSLLNAIVGQNISLVSEFKGTTTDPVMKAMEFIPFGPVLFIDTAGFDDESVLGNLRINKTLKMFQRTDFAIYVIDGAEEDKISFEKTVKKFKEFNIPYISIVNKVDIVESEKLNLLKEKYNDAIFISTKNTEDILKLKETIINKIEKNTKEPPIIGDLLPYNSSVIMVVPIDSEAPKGRLILPQVQVLRECLDYGIKSYVVRDAELKSALNDIKNVDLVITDSQAFKQVEKIIPKDMKLTSFSILFARHKGDLNIFKKGLEKVSLLNENSKILITESCTHNTSHEDIGRVKIPKLLNKYTEKNLNYDFLTGHDFPNEKEINKYDFIIHCGSCMMNIKSMRTRLDFCLKNNISITNYGVLLAYLNGIFERSVEIMD